MWMSGNMVKKTLLPTLPAAISTGRKAAVMSSPVSVESSMFNKQSILAGCVFIDLFAVSLIVPLLPIRFKELGVSPVMIGMIGSVYSISQIIGGLVIGMLSDRLEDRRSVLLLSIFGAAISYAMVGFATSVPILLLSRVIVGAVKQTMTVSKALAALWSEDHTRAASMGVMTAAASAAWVSGSAITGLVYKLNPLAPSYLAVLLYIIDACIVQFILPPALRVHHIDDRDSDKPSKRPSFLASFHRAFGNRSVATFVVIKLIYELIFRSGNSMQDVWEMDRFGLKVYELSELRTFKSIFTILLQGKVAGMVVTKYGEKQAFLVAVGLGIWGCMVQYHVSDVMRYAILSVPADLTSAILSTIALESLMTHLVPKSELGSALAVTDVLHSAVGVIAPMIGGVVIQYWGLLAKPLFTGGAYAVLFAIAWLYMPKKVIELYHKEEVRVGEETVTDDFVHLLEKKEL